MEMPGTDEACRRFALQLAAQLPEDALDARRVLCYCCEIVDKFLDIAKAEGSDQEAVLAGLSGSVVRFPDIR